MNDNIKHIVLLLLENHSFDQMLGALQEINPDLDGVLNPEIRPLDDATGNTFHLQPTHETQMLNDPHHEFIDVQEQLENNNSGFIRNFAKHYPSSTIQERQAIMGYYPLDFLPALHTLGRNFTVCDRWFSSVPGPTWPNRFFALTGTTLGSVHMPEKGHLEMLWNQTQDTIFDRLTDAEKKWKIYYYDFPCSLILKRLREPEKRGGYQKIDDFFKAAHGPENEFPDFAFIEPKYYGKDQNDDHPPHNTMKAQKLIADVYQAIRGNKELWEKTLLVVLYDEHGGFYDHVVPPSNATPPDEYKNDGFDFTRYGVRVPAILVSPWVGARVEHTLFDHTSLLKYMQEKWNLKSLTKRIDSANSIGIALTNNFSENTPGSIRVPYTDLIPDHPEWELLPDTSHSGTVGPFVQHLWDHLLENIEEYASNHNGINFEIKGLNLAGNFKTFLYKISAKMGVYILKLGNWLVKHHHQHMAQKIEIASKLIWMGVDTKPQNKS